MAAKLSRNYKKTIAAVLALLLIFTIFSYTIFPPILSPAQAFVGAIAFDAHNSVDTCNVHSKIIPLTTTGNSHDRRLRMTYTSKTTSNTAVDPNISLISKTILEYVGSVIMLILLVYAVLNKSTKQGFKK